MLIHYYYFINILKLIIINLYKVFKNKIVIKCNKKVMPLNYNNGKIYKIINLKNEVIYIGSTAQEKLCKRFSTHKHRGNGNKIVLLELYPCSCKEELVKKEQEVIEQYDNLLNQVRAYRVEEYKQEQNKEYYKKYFEKNRDKIKLYRDNNKEKIKEYLKQYRENTGYNKEYYEENKNKILEQNKVKILCECGCEITQGYLSAHKKTKNHIKLMENIII